MAGDSPTRRGGNTPSDFTDTSIASARLRKRGGNRKALASRECGLGRKSVTALAQRNLSLMCAAHCLPLEGKVGRSEAESRMRCLNSLKKALIHLISQLSLTASPQGEANALAITPPCLFGASNSRYFRPCGRAMLARMVWFRQNNSKRDTATDVFVVA